MIAEMKITNSELFLKDFEKETNYLENPGSLNGSLGTALVFYLLSKQNNDKSFAEKGMQLLENISEYGVSGRDLSFNSGLTGIGWAIEWLNQNELMEDTNTDEVLDSIDNILYKAVSYVKDENISLKNGTLGKIAYFLKRASSRNPDTNRLKTIGHLECLVLLLDDLAEKVEKGIPNQNLQEYNSETSSIKLTDLADVLIIISSINVKVNTPTSGKILYGSIAFAEALLSANKHNLQSEQTSSSCNNFDLLYLSIGYLIAAKNKNNKFWLSRALAHVETLATSLTKHDEMSVEESFRLLLILNLLNEYAPSIGYRTKLEALIQTLTPLQIPFTLINGRGILVISELWANSPTLIENWHEILYLAKTQ